MEISNEIRRIRYGCLLSQIEFAREIGVSFSTVNRWENGKAIPNYQTLKKIKDFCEKRNTPFLIDLQEWQDNRTCK